MAGTPIKRARREAGLMKAPSAPPRDSTRIMKIQAEREAQNVHPPSNIRKVMVDVLGERRFEQMRTLTDMEVNEVEQFVLSSEVSDLKALMQADKTPIYLKSLISAIFTDMKNGNSRTVETLRDRQYGSIAQRLEVSGQDGMPIANVQMTADDARRMLAEINANC